jgi:hypothetical protein
VSGGLGEALSTLRLGSGSIPARSVCDCVDKVSSGLRLLRVLQVPFDGIIELPLHIVRSTVTSTL